MSAKYQTGRQLDASPHLQRLLHLTNHQVEDGQHLGHANLQAVIDVLQRDQTLVDYPADRLVALGDSVPAEIESMWLGNGATPFDDARLYDYRNYPADLYVAPGTAVANRAALAKWGAWANALAAREYGGPLSSPAQRT